MSRAVIRSAVTLAALLAPAVAFAHPGSGAAHGVVQGLAHPLGGIDHVLAMLAVGVMAGQMRGHARWLLPAAFLGAMMAGGVAGLAGLALPLAETGIALSVAVLGAAVALRRDLHVAAAMALVAVFAVFHGHAHGAEMPAGTGAAAYAAGFVMATAALHAVGFALAGLAPRLAGHAAGARLVQASGAAMAVAGAGLLAGLL